MRLAVPKRGEAERGGRGDTMASWSMTRSWSSAWAMARALRRSTLPGSGEVRGSTPDGGGKRKSHLPERRERVEKAARLSLSLRPSLFACGCILVLLHRIDRQCKERRKGIRGCEAERTGGTRRGVSRKRQRGPGRTMKHRVEEEINGGENARGEGGRREGGLRKRQAGATSVKGQWGHLRGEGLTGTSTRCNEEPRHSIAESSKGPSKRRQRPACPQVGKCLRGVGEGSRHF